MSEHLDTQPSKGAKPRVASRGKDRVLLIVLHDLFQSAEQIKTAAQQPHYFIALDGTVSAMVPEQRVATLGGIALWNKRHRNISRIGISIGLESAPDTPAPDAQLIALHGLIDELQQRYDLDDAAIVRWRDGDQPGQGSIVPTLPPLPLIHEPPAPPAPLVLGADESALRLWVFLQSETYNCRSNGFKYTLNDLNRSQAFPIYATQQNLGAPVAPNEPTPVVVNNVTYNFQPFARATLFNVGRNYAAVQNLNDMLDYVVPDKGVARALLEASYKASQDETKRRVGLHGHEGFRENWRFHVTAMRSKLGPALSGNYATADGVYAVQVFAGDTLYTPRTELAGCRFLSQTEPSDPAYQPIWIETYKVCGAPYDPNSPFQQLAAKERLGTPLSGVYTAQHEGVTYTIQVFALDTLYAGPDGQIRRMSALEKPADVQAWKPASASLPEQPAAVTFSAPPPNVSSTPVRDPNWPPFPNFKPLPNRAARDAAFGAFSFTRGEGNKINIDPAWVQANICEVTIPQLQRLIGNRKVRFHRRVVDQLLAMWAAWESAGLLHLILTYDGDWYPRVMAGNSSEISMHAYGAAFDINVKWNGFLARATLVGDKGSVRELVPIANHYGFYWGGHFRYNKTDDSSDGMHFEWARPL